MKQLSLLTFLLILLLTCVGRSVAQTEIAPEKRAAIKELLDVTGAYENTQALFRGFYDTFAARERQEALDAAAKLPDMKKVSSERKGQMMAAVERFLNRLLERSRAVAQQALSAEKLADIAISAYDKYFTLDEIKELVAFQKTPTGRKLAAVQAQLALEIERNTETKIGAGLLKTLETIRQEELKAFEQELNQINPPAPKGKTAARRKP